MESKVSDEKFSLSVFRPDNMIEIDGCSDIAKAIIHFDDQKLLIKKRGGKLIIDAIYGNKTIHTVNRGHGMVELNVVDTNGVKSE